MKNKLRKQIVFQASKKIYNGYRNKGLVSIYLYGSGFNDKDFNKDSDIDLIGLAEDNFPLKYEKEMISELQKHERLDIKIRILSLSELNGGRIKSSLAKVLPIKLLLMDFKNYIHLHGKKFDEKNFKIKKANFNEAGNIEFKLYLEKKKQFLSNNDLSMYLIKSAIYYFYYKSCQGKGYFDFSYHDLAKKVLEEYKDIVRKLIKIKDKGYKVKDTKEIIIELDKLIKK